MLDLFLLVAFGQTVATAVACLGECTTVSKRARRNAAKQRQNMRKTRSSAASTTPSPGNPMNRRSMPSQEKQPLPKALKQRVNKLNTTGTTYTTETKEKTEMGPQLKNPPANPAVNKQPLEKKSNEKLPPPKSDKKTKVATKVEPVKSTKKQEVLLRNPSILPPKKSAEKLRSGRINRSLDKAKSDDKRKKAPKSLEEVTAISTKKKSREQFPVDIVKISTAEPLVDQNDIGLEKDEEEETMALVKSLEDDPNPSRGEVRKQENNNEPTPEL